MPSPTKYAASPAAKQDPAELAACTAPLDEEGRTTHPAALAECVVPLDEHDRCAVRRYWDRVVREEEWVAPSRWVPGPVSVEGSGRERREARRAVLVMACVVGRARGVGPGTGVAA